MLAGERPPAAVAHAGGQPPAASEPPAAVAHAGGKPPAASEPLAAVVQAGEQPPAAGEKLAVSKRPGGHILGSHAVTEFTVDAGSGLGATQLSVFQQFLSLVPVAQDYRGGATVALPPTLHVRVVDDDRG